MAKKTDNVPASYAAATQEIDQILRAVEDPALPIDELGPRIERAAVLIAWCREVLENTEVRVVDALRGLQESAQASAQRTQGRGPGA
jgi:exodeoxyribonuclease VII small subunit